jgi:hypothetical protein
MIFLKIDIVSNYTVFDLTTSKFVTVRTLGKTGSLFRPNADDTN